MKLIRCLCLLFCFGGFIAIGCKDSSGSSAAAPEKPSGETDPSKMIKKPGEFK